MARRKKADERWVAARRREWPIAASARRLASDIAEVLKRTDAERWRPEPECLSFVKEATAKILVCYQPHVEWRENRA